MAINANICPDFDRYSAWVIRKGKITKDRFPTFRLPIVGAAASGTTRAANNPQAGAPASMTFLDAAGTNPDKFGVSGFMVQDQNGRQFC
ncbi:hypothetical protein FOVG_19412 [Fusarium oxysporum f. sp. pisi HDV247]|uniref:Uncharacterized protein n=1 Tax=Fusarium oxysporum f. sp. pisi HDV247 TaxID=1080344 RepID=W9NE84_FUSOX|nr:hypothetical protein FOVG_19412 [Fusarium oxysporum f. sp. pisi HDV247]